MKYERFKIIGEVFQPDPTGLLYYYLSVCSVALTNMSQVILCLTIRLSLSKYNSYSIVVVELQMGKPFGIKSDTKNVRPDLCQVKTGLMCGAVIA